MYRKIMIKCKRNAHYTTE